MCSSSRFPGWVTTCSETTFTTLLLPLSLGNRFLCNLVWSFTEADYFCSTFVDGSSFPCFARASADWLFGPSFRFCLCSASSSFTCVISADWMDAGLFLMSLTVFYWSTLYSKWGLRASMDLRLLPRPLSSSILSKALGRDSWVWLALRILSQLIFNIWSF